MTPIERATAAVMEGMGDGPGSRDYLRAQAIVRAVIAAIREPSVDMAVVGGNRKHIGSGDMWRAMIDQLLEEGQ